MAPCFLWLAACRLSSADQQQRSMLNAAGPSSIGSNPVVSAATVITVNPSKVYGSGRQRSAGDGVADCIRSCSFCGKALTGHSHDEATAQRQDHESPKLLDKPALQGQLT